MLKCKKIIMAPVLAGILFGGCSTKIDKNDMLDKEVLNSKEMLNNIRDGYKSKDRNIEIGKFVEQEIILEDYDGLEYIPSQKLTMELEDVNIQEFIKELSKITGISIISDFKNRNNFHSNNRQSVSNLTVRKKENISLNIPITIKKDSKGNVDFNAMLDDKKSNKVEESSLKTEDISANSNSNSRIKSSQSDTRNLINMTVKDIPLRKMIEAIERSQNVDFTYDVKSKILYVKDYITIQGNFLNLNSEIDIYSKIESNLGKILESDEKKIIIDQMTGTFYITSTPNEMRDSKMLIENTINEASAYALLEVKIYKINNSKLKEIGLNTDVLVKDIYNLSTGAGIGSTALFDLSITKKFKQGDIDFSMGLKMLEQRDIINSVTTPFINIFNGMDSILEDTKEVGQWIPGAIVQNDTLLNGISTTTFTEDKPEFLSEDVGNTLKIKKPKINMDNKSLYLDIEWEESKIYANSSTVWNRTAGNSITLDKPLKAVTKLNTRAILYDKKYTIISGTKQKTANLSNQDVPGFRNIMLDFIGTDSENNSVNDILIIAKPSFSSIYTKSMVYKNINFIKDNKPTIKKAMVEKALVKVIEKPIVETIVKKVKISKKERDEIRAKKLKKRMDRVKRLKALKEKKEIKEKKALIVKKDSKIPVIKKDKKTLIVKKKEIIIEKKIPTKLIIEKKIHKEVEIIKVEKAKEKMKEVENSLKKINENKKRIEKLARENSKDGKLIMGPEFIIDKNIEILPLKKTGNITILK